MAYIGSAYVTGLLIASFFSRMPCLLTGAVLLGLGTVLLILLRRGRDSRLYKMAVCAVSCSVGLLYYCCYDVMTYETILSDSEKSFEGVAVIESVKVYSDENAFFTGYCTLPCGKKSRIGWYGNFSEAVRGDKAYLSGVLYVPSDGGLWNKAEYYRSEGVFLFLRSIEKEEYIISENNIFAAVSRFRENAVSIIKNYVPTDEGELIAGMIFGRAYMNLPYSTENALYRSGVGHIACVSGLHISLAAGMAAALASALGLSKQGRFSLVFLAAFAFALSAGLTVSVRRSFIMIILVYAGGLLRRCADPLSSLCTAAVIITAGSPFIVRSPSFLLSFSGTAGAAVLSEWVIDTVRDAYEERFLKEPGRNPVLSAFVVSMCAGAAVMPAGALLYDEISLVSPIANLLLAPFYTAAAGISLTGALITAVPALRFVSGGLFLTAGVLCRPVLETAELLSGDGSVFPARLAVTAPVIVTVLAVSAAAGVLLKKRSSVMLAFSVVFFICSCFAAVYRYTPSEETYLRIVTDMDGCILILCENGCAAVYDFMGRKQGAHTARGIVGEMGAVSTGLVCTTVSSGFCAPVYKDIFGEAQIVSAARGTGLFYRENKDAVKFKDTYFYPCTDYDIIRTAGINIIVINGKCAPPEEHFSLCIYNCAADVYVCADNYAVTNSRFKGKLSEGTVLNTDRRFVIADGRLCETGAGKWLR